MSASPAMKFGHSRGQPKHKTGANGKSTQLHDSPTGCGVGEAGRWSRQWGGMRGVRARRAIARRRKHQYPNTRSERGLSNVAIKLAKCLALAWPRGWRLLATLPPALLFAPNWRRSPAMSDFFDHRNRGFFDDIIRGFFDDTNRGGRVSITRCHIPYIDHVRIDFGQPTSGSPEPHGGYHALVPGLRGEGG